MYRQRAPRAAIDAREPDLHISPTGFDSWREAMEALLSELGVLPGDEVDDECLKRCLDTLDRRIGEAQGQISEIITSQFSHVRGAFLASDSSVDRVDALSEAVDGIISALMYPEVGIRRRCARAAAHAPGASRKAWSRACSRFPPTSTPPPAAWTTCSARWTRSRPFATCVPVARGRPAARR